MERAIAAGIQSAADQIQDSARALTANAIVGVTLSVAGVADKAEAIIMAGTAVRLTPLPEE